jgi:hypothetical protein
MYGCAHLHTEATATGTRIICRFKREHEVLRGQSTGNSSA